MSCNSHLHFESVCDWPNYWSVQSLPRHATSSVSCHVLLTWRRSGGRVSLCNLRLHFESVCNSPCHGGCSILRQWIAHVVYLNETESCCAIQTCTLIVSVTGPTTGLSNPCLDTQHLLCLVMYCSRGGEVEAESHCATYNCTLRVSATVLATAAVQSSDNGLLTWCIQMRQSHVVQFKPAL